jgi:hypothetical protein
VHQVAGPQVVGVGVGEGQGVGLAAHGGRCRRRPRQESVDRGAPKPRPLGDLARQRDRLHHALNAGRGAFLAKGDQMVLHLLGDHVALSGVRAHGGLEPVEAVPLVQADPIPGRRAAHVGAARSRDRPLLSGDRRQERLLLSRRQGAGHQLADDPVAKQRHLLAQRVVHRRLSPISSRKSIPGLPAMLREGAMTRELPISVGGRPGAAPGSPEAKQPARSAEENRVTRPEPVAQAYQRAAPRADHGPDPLQPALRPRRQKRHEKDDPSALRLQTPPPHAPSGFVPRFPGCPSSNGRSRPRVSGRLHCRQRRVSIRTQVLGQQRVRHAAGRADQPS